MLTPAEATAELDYRTRRVVADVGLYLDVEGAGDRTRAFEEGLRRGLRDVGRMPFAGSGPLDPRDLLGLSSTAEERVLDLAEWSVWNRVLLAWDVAARQEGVPAYAPADADPTRNGWRADQRRAIEAARDEIALRLKAPYREPGPCLVVNDPPAAPPWSGPHFYRHGGYSC